MLLFVSMFLFGFVILMLWQRNGIQQETQVSEKLLHIAAASISPDDKITAPQMFTKEISNYFNENGIICLQWQDSKGGIQSHGSCQTDASLTALLKKAAATGKTKTIYSGMTWNGFFLTKQYLRMAIPLHINQKNQGSIALIRSLEQVCTSIRKAQKIFFAYLAVNVIIFTTIGFTRLLHLVIKPIQRLASLADSRTDLSDTSFFSGEGLGEFTQLSLSLNRLLTRIDVDKQELRSTVESLKNANDKLQKNRNEMVRTEKLASIGRLSAGLAHEIGNPLGIIQGYIDLLTDSSLSDEDRKSFCTRAVQELNRINALIRNLLDLSRSPVASSIEKVDVHALLQDLIATVRVRKTSVPIDYLTDFSAANNEVTINSDNLRQVFLNCILNSIDAIEETEDKRNGTITLSTENKVSEKNGNAILIAIQDNGTGVSPEHKDTLFDPFFTTKEVGKGTGLGLAVAHNLIKNSGGQITLSSQTGQGATLSITLPISSQPKAPSRQGDKA